MENTVAALNLVKRKIRSLFLEAEREGGWRNGASRVKEQKTRFREGVLDVSLHEGGIKEEEATIEEKKGLYQKGRDDAEWET